jgi:hypothetical protein
MKTGFFEEEQGVKSMVRLMSFIVIVAAVVIASYQGYMQGAIDIPGFIAMAGVAVGGKVWQRTVEDNV